MQIHRVDRRSVLEGLGTAAVIGLAGCSSSQNEPATSGETAGPLQDESATPGETADPLQIEEFATGNIDRAAGVNGMLTYTTDGGSQRIVHGDNEYPPYGTVANGRVAPHDYIAVDNSIAYRGITKDNRTVEEVIMVGDEELHRNTFEESPNPNDVKPSATLWGAVDGDAIWAEPTAQSYSASFFIGEEEINPAFDGVSSVRPIDGEIMFVGLKMNENDRWLFQKLVRGDTTVWDFAANNEAFGGILEDINGTPAFVKRTRSGEVIQYGDQEVGGQYTEPGDGEFQWVGELDGSLAFIVQVARDKIKSSQRIREQVLWHDGEEIDRREYIGTNVHGFGVAYTDEGLVYSFSDSESDTSGVVIGGTVEELGYSPSHVASIDGTPAYEAPAEGGGLSVNYGAKQTDPQPQILTIFEIDGDLAYLAQTEDGAPESDAIYREV